MDIIKLTPSDVDVFRAIPKGNRDFNLRYALVADWREGEGWALTVIETRKMPEGYEPSTVDRRVRIAVNGRNEVYRATTAKRFVASGDAYADTTPTALGNLVRAGDALHVRFRIGNNTEGMKTAGFEHDECDVLVTRGAKDTLIAVMRLADVISNNSYNMSDNMYRPERDGGAA